MDSSILSRRPLSLPASHAPVKSVAFGQSKHLMATGDTEVVVRIWREGELLHEIDPRSDQEKVRSTERIRGLEFSTDSRYLYVSASDRLQAFDVESGNLVWEHAAPRYLGFLVVSPQAIAVASTGMVAASFDHGSMATFSPDGDRLGLIRDNYAPRMMGFCPHGRVIVGADGFNLCAWDAFSGERVHRWRLEQRVYALAVSKFESLVATRELRTLTIWDIDRFERVCELPAGRGLPLLAFSPVERVLASGERTRIRVIDLVNQGVKDFDAEGATVLSVTFTPDGKSVVAGCSDHRVRIWQLDA